MLIDLPNTKASANVLEKLDVAPVIDSKIVSVILKDSLCSLNLSPTDLKISFCSLCFSTPLLKSSLNSNLFLFFSDNLLAITEPDVPAPTTF